MVEMGNFKAYYPHRRTHHQTNPQQEFERCSYPKPVREQLGQLPSRLVELGGGGGGNEGQFKGARGGGTKLENL